MMDISSIYREKTRIKQYNSILIYQQQKQNKQNSQDHVEIVDLCRKGDVSVSPLAQL